MSKEAEMEAVKNIDPMMQAEHDYDPRTRLCLVLCLSSLSVFMNDNHWLAGVFLLTVLIAYLFGGDLGTLFKRLQWVLYMFFFLAVVQSAFGPAESVYVAIGGVRLLTDYGLNAGLLFALRISIIMLSASVLVQETSRRMVQALVQLRLPYELAFMSSIAIRFLKILVDEMGNSLTAIQLRGVDLAKIPWRKRVSVYTYLLLPVLSGAVFKARQLSLSLELRGFKLHRSRSSYFRLCLRAKDWRIIIIAPVLAGLMFVAYLICG